MAKAYPVQIVLKSRKCPQCGEKDFGHPDLKPKESSVQAACRNTGCDFRMDLFWIGDNNAWSN
ncbi:MAG: hypothetical protein HY554_18900 [Elusimicrobia bacterium]|nr:hypothetical protein [Elusimicrobiota bacterium]